MKEKLIVGKDMICPVLKVYCTDECCTVGSECNLSGEQGEEVNWDYLKFSGLDKPFVNSEENTDDALVFLKNILNKAGVRKHLNINDSGYSQLERDIVDGIKKFGHFEASQHKNPISTNKKTIMTKRKYTIMGETPIAYECTKRKCKWQGTPEQKQIKRIDNSTSEFVCPECENNEFYGLLKLPNT